MATDRDHGGSGSRSRSGGPKSIQRQAQVDQLVGFEHGPDATQRATEEALARSDNARSIVLVEGISDQIAVETLAERMGRRLAEEPVVVMPIGGAHAAKHFVPRFANPRGVKLSGLVDRAEEVHFRRALAEVGLVASTAGPAALESQGFFVCDADLEEELIRSLDQKAIESVLGSEGDLDAFRSLQNQPVWRNRPFEEQMHRWLRSVALRGSRYARLLVLEAEAPRIPRPLTNLVNRI